jgi:5-methylcytosine-specific restriction endonuclease McrA
MRRRYYEANKDRWDYAPEERERIAARMRDYRLKDPEGVRAREKASRQAQPLEAQQRRAQEAYARAAQRRARQREAVCEHGPDCVTADLLAALRKQACRYCGVPAEHIDHYVPLKQGGLHCRTNLVPACALCNLSKGARTPEEWIEYLRKRGAA